MSQSYLSNLLGPPKIPFKNAINGKLYSYINGTKRVIGTKITEEQLGPAGKRNTSFLETANGQKKSIKANDQVQLYEPAVAAPPPVEPPAAAAPPPFEPPAAAAPPPPFEPPAAAAPPPPFKPPAAASSTPKANATSNASPSISKAAAVLAAKSGEKVTFGGRSRSKKANRTKKHKKHTKHKKHKKHNPRT